MFVFFILMTMSLGFASTSDECIQKVDASWNRIFEFTEGKASDQEVRQIVLDAGKCLSELDVKSKKQNRDKAIAAWKIFSEKHEEEVLPTVGRFNQLAKDNKANLDRTLDALRSLGQSECIQKANQARSELLLYKDGLGHEEIVNQAARDTSQCIDAIQARGEVSGKERAVRAWQDFRAVREKQIIPCIKDFVERLKESLVYLEKTKAALRAIKKG